MHPWPGRQRCSTGEHSLPTVSPWPGSSSGWEALPPPPLSSGWSPSSSGWCPGWPTAWTVPYGHVSEAGGFLDITADFVVYGTTVVGVAVGVAQAYGAPWWPFLLVLLTYYVNGTAFLAFSSIAERTGRTMDDGRSLSFLGGLAEGTETIVVHSVWLVFPQAAWQIAVGWALVVGVSALQRVVAGYRDLS